ncbi:MAG: threonine synthase [Bacteroidota bacterium]
MQLYSTNHQSPSVSLEEAIFRGLPPDNGLYLPEKIATLPESFFQNIQSLSFPELASVVATTLLGDAIPESEVRKIVYKAIDFDAPLVSIEQDTFVLELFHGPSMAFKDFGGRFMAGLMSYFLQQSKKEIHILVATSGDTGGAVAQGFHRTPGVKVTILYPSKKVSDIQEKQLTTLGDNVTALEVNGTFDDCQHLVKQAFLDEELNQKYNLSSANSINIARLIPQTFYYFYAYAQAQKFGKPVVFSVPSGNFGNLSAGLIAQKMGLPVHQFIAATNLNHIVPDYLKTGNYSPKPSVETISNAMDVGNPSNFARMQALFGSQLERLQEKVTGAYYDDEQTRAAIQKVYQQTGYVMCPHTAVAYLGLKEYRTSQGSDDFTGIFLATAHPAKFLPTVEEAIGAKVPLPTRLAELLDKKKAATSMTNRFPEFKAWLMSR